MSSPAELPASALDPETLLEQLDRQLPRPTGYWVAFSGGLDSTVLLQLLAMLRPRLAAPLSVVHVDHALQPQSVAWAEHCQRVCAELDIPLHSLRVDAMPRRGESPEAAARRARYVAIAQLLGPRAMLLTAHHRDDQAETLLLQMFRGAGVEGLSAMPVVRSWNRGWLARPLLGVQRASIRAWAEARGLNWVEDPSNMAGAADRNYLRHQVMPAIAARWPGAVDSMARSAAHCADAAGMLRSLAERDLRHVSVADRLELARLRSLPSARSRNLMRQWLREHRAPPLSSRRLQDALQQLCHARSDAAVRIEWGGVEIRRFRDQAWLIRPSPVTDDRPRVDWAGEALRLPFGLGRVRRFEGAGGISPQAWREGRVQIGYRNSAFRCRPAGRSGSRTFKKIAQEYGIPPWQRDIVPVLLIDDCPAAVANYCVCQPFAVEAGQPGWMIEWIPD